MDPIKPVIILQFRINIIVFVIVYLLANDNNFKKLNVDYPEGGLVSLRWLFSWDINSSFVAKFFVIVKLSLPPLSLYYYRYYH